MFKKSRLMLLAAAAAIGVLAFQGQAQAQGVRAGVLTCNVASGWGFIIGSTRDLNCTFSPAKGGPAWRYTGSISKFGVDIGYQQSAVIVWAVLAGNPNVTPDSLAGSYAGVTGGASVGAGAGANALIGGFNN